MGISLVLLDLPSSIPKPEPRGRHRRSCRRSPTSICQNPRRARSSRSSIPRPAPTEPPTAAPPVIELRPVEPALPAGAMTAFCGVPAIGSSVVFVIDRSASMGLEGRLERACTELQASLQRLPPTARFQVIAYHRHPAGARRQWIAAGDGGIHSVSNCRGGSAQGRRRHRSHKRLRAALAMQPDVICFLTDDDELTPEQVREITRLNRAGPAFTRSASFNHSANHRCPSWPGSIAASSESSKKNKQ